MRERTFDGSEGEIFYRTWDVTPRRRVMIVHGYAEHSGRYNHVARRLVAEAGATVYAEDHIGHGRSVGDRALITDFEHVVDDLRTLEAISRTEHPGTPLIVAGHSMGGLLAARFAERHPELVAGLVFLGAVIGDWDWARRALEDPELMATPSDPAGMSRDPETVRQYAEDPLVYHGLYKRPLLEAEVDALDRFNDQIGRLTMPVLFMHGTEDPFVPWQTSLDAVLRMPGEEATIRLFKGARHELVNETNRDEVIDELVRFVDRF